MKELKYWNGRWFDGDLRRIVVAAYTKKQAIDITGCSNLEITQYWHNNASDKQKEFLGGKVGVVVFHDGLDYKVFFQGDRIPGTVDAPVVSKAKIKVNDTPRIIWSVGTNGPILFNIVGETVDFYKVPNYFPGTEKYRLLKKDPEVFFEDRDACLAQCKEEAKQEWVIAQRNLQKITERRLALDALARPKNDIILV